MSESESTELEQTDPTRVRGKFAPGHSGNPTGRPRGIRNALIQFWDALEADARKHKETIWEYAIKQARVDNSVLKAVLERALPMAAVIRIEDGGFMSSPTGAEEERVAQARRALHAEIEAAREAEILVVEVGALVGKEEVGRGESKPCTQTHPGNGKGNGKQATQA